MTALLLNVILVHLSYNAFHANRSFISMIVPGGKIIYICVEMTTWAQCAVRCLWE